MELREPRHTGTSGTGNRQCIWNNYTTSSVPQRLVPISNAANING